MIIKNCYDSHLHWQGIGSFKCRLNLSEVKSLNELNNLSPSKQNYRSNWLLGHGWNKSIFNDSKSPVKYLDKLYPETPVYFTSHDIHCVWLNSTAIKALGINNKAWMSEFSEYIDILDGEFTGLFYDLAKDNIDKKLPKYTSDQVREHLLIAQDELIKAGITHIRDLTCSQEQLNQALKLEVNNQLLIAADLFFKLNTFDELDQHIANVLSFKTKQINKLKVKGVKVFIDGALGSGGALLTSCYLDNSNGFKLFSDAQLEEIIKKCFANNLEVAFHAIGDQPSLDVCKILLKLKKEGITGKVHLEHVQILTDECINLINELNIVCHMQPQHWCSDKDWLHKKIPKEALNNIFRWADLEKKQIELFFGSDAPVENLSIGNLLKCLGESAKNGISPLKNDIMKYISYPGRSPVKSETYLDSDLNVDKVVINDKVVYQA